MKFQDLTGQKFGRLTVIKRAENIKDRTAWLCKCECGNIIKTTGHNLKTGNTKSCGCLAREQAQKNVQKMIEHNIKNNYKNTVTHGLSQHRLYNTWSNMKDRCYRNKNSHFKYYGGKGIVVCKEWLNDFQAFYVWAINNGYENDLTIDRIDFNGNYEPSNCRWITRKEQNRNTTQCIYYKYKNKKYTRGQLSEISGLPYATIRYRLDNGWLIEEAITTETNTKKIKQDN